MDGVSDGSNMEGLPRSGESKKSKRIKKPCSVEGCCTLAHLRGLCSKHGGYTSCDEEGCTEVAKAGGLCIAHGGQGSKKKPCSVEGCCTLAAKRGLCGKHGGR